MLKKICVILSSVILLLSLYFNNKTPVFTGLANTFEVYLTNYSDSSAELSLDKKGVIFLAGIKGESCIVEKENFNIQYFLQQMNASIVFTHEFDGCINYYAYSPKIKYCETVDGKFINLHICIKNDKIKLGSPIIYGSF